MSKTVQFPRIDRNGNKVGSTGVLGSLGFSQNLAVNLEPGNPLELALFNAVNESPLDDEQTELLRSFLYAWLIRKKSELNEVVASTVALPESIGYLQKIGMFGRFFGSLSRYGKFALATAVVLKVNFVALDLLIEEGESLPEIATSVGGSMIGMGVADALFTKWMLVEKGVEKEFGLPGSPINRKQFDPHVVFAFLNLCYMRKALLQVKNSTSKKDWQIQYHSLNFQIAKLFLSISRQLNGLVLAGQAEVSVAVASYTALALGLRDCKQEIDVYELLEQNVDRWPNAWREEGIDCLKRFSEVLKKESYLVEVEMDRNLTLSMTAEVAECVSYPIGAVMRLLGGTAGVLGNLAPSPATRNLFNATENGMKEVASAIETSPGLLAKVGRGGVAIESWIRSTVARWSPS